MSADQPALEEQRREWFAQLDRALAVPPGQAGLGPGAQETSLLLQMGKWAAEVGPERMYALLTAFALGRGLGRAEQADPSVDGLAYLRSALALLRGVPVAAPDRSAD